MSARLSRVISLALLTSAFVSILMPDTWALAGLSDSMQLAALGVIMSQLARIEAVKP